MNITKRFYFEAAHRLMHHKGKCKNIHGHNYVVDVTRLDLIKNKINGITIDFNDLHYIQYLIDNDLDHALLLNRNDKLLAQFCQDNEMKYYLFDSDPTAESITEKLKYNLSRYYDIFENEFTVTVYENKDCWVTK